MSLLCTEHYCLEEFACKCGCGFNPTRKELLYLCEFIRLLNGDKPLPILEGSRCKAYNDKVGGANDSLHVFGTAAHLPVDDPEKIYRDLESIFLYTHGLGLHGSYIHVDIRDKKARW